MHVSSPARAVTFTAIAFALTAAAGPRPAAAEIINAISAFPISVDGAFDPLAEEWSDITPLAFIAGPPQDPGGAAFPTFTPDEALAGDVGLLVTTVDDPNANVFTYAAIAPGVEPDPPGGGPPVLTNEFYLAYDFLGRTDLNFAPGEQIANIFFEGFAIDDVQTSVNVQIFAAEIVAVALATPGGGLAIPIDVVVDAGEFGVVSGDALGMEAAVGLGASPNSDTAHLIIELEMALNAPARFFDPELGLDGDLQPTGYSPDPAFWGANVNGGSFSAITSATFTINPDGTTTIVANAIEAPAPATALLLLVGLAAAWRRTARG